MHTGDNPFAAGLGRNRANYVPLSPVQFLERSALIYRIAWRCPWRTRLFLSRVRRALPPLSICARTRGGRSRRHRCRDGAERSALLETCYAVPARNAVLNAMNVRRPGHDRVLPATRQSEGTPDRSRIRHGREDRAGTDKPRASGYRHRRCAGSSGTLLCREAPAKPGAGRGAAPGRAHLW